MFPHTALRFQGYWAGLFAWLVLTFAVPLSAIAVDEQSGWMRLCSSAGVHWVQIDEPSSSQASVQCGCLSLAVTFDAPPYSVASKPQVMAVYRWTPRLPMVRPPYQPRSPPVFAEIRT